jgi:hypothetical protein
MLSAGVPLLAQVRLAFLALWRRRRSEQGKEPDTLQTGSFSTPEEVIDLTPTPASSTSRPHEERSW